MHRSLPWCPPPEVLTLGKDEVHVWRASLSLPPPRVQSLQRTLVAEELMRAERYCFQRDREHFIVARGLLREILGWYLRVEPGQLRFSYGPHGKPDLAQEMDGDGLHFNVAHSDGLALFAVGRGRRIGVDLERLRPELASERIAEQFFSPREVAVLRALPTDVQPEAFFNCWTRKEAYLKAIGNGLALPLDQFDVSLTPGEPAALLSVSGGPESACHWSLREVDVGLGYIAAVAVVGQGWQLKCWQWTDQCAPRVR